MSQKTPSPEGKKTKRGWLKKTLIVAGWMLLCLVVFHRPIIHYGVPPLVGLFAKKQNLNVGFKLSGSIFTSLYINDVKVTPTGGGPTPVRRIDIRAMEFHYSIPRLIKSGIGYFLSSYQLHDADLEFVALPSKTEEEKKEKVTIAQQLYNILAQPAAYADKAWIENVTVQVHSPEADTFVGPLNLLLDPEKQGYLKVGKIQAPGIPTWENIDATTSYKDRNLFIRGLELAPELVIEEINFDASNRESGAGSMALTAKVFGGRLHLELSGRELNAPGEKLEKSYITHLVLNVSGIDVAAAGAYFGAPDLPVGKVAKIDVDFTGEPERPATWTTTTVIALDEYTAGGLAIRAIQLNLDAKDGEAKLRAGAEIASNAARIEATASLPPKLEQFDAIDMDAEVRVTAPKLAEIGAMLEPPQPLKGDATIVAKVNAKDRRVTADVSAKLDGVAFGGQAIGKGELALRGTMPATPDPKNPLTGVNADLSLFVSAIQSGTLAIDSARVAAQVRGREISLQTLEVLRGENAISAKGVFTVPEDMAQVAKTPGDLEFTIALPKLAEFGLGGEGKTLTGSLNGRGQVHIENQLPTGLITLDGSDLEYAGGKAESLNAKIALQGETAVIENLSLKLNEADGLKITGTAGTQKPFAYDASLDFAIRDLAIFQPLLDEMKIEKKLTGAVSIHWKGKGKVEPMQHAGTVDANVNGLVFGDAMVKEIKLNGPYAIGETQSGTIKLDVADVEYAGAKVEGLSAKVVLEGDTAVIEGFGLRFNDEDRLAITGRVGTKEPFAYDATAKLGIRNLAIFQPLLDEQKMDKKLSGAVALNWNGTGEVKPAQHSGEMKLDVDDVVFGDLKVQEVRIAGRYSPEKAESRAFHIAMGPTVLDGVIEWEAGKLRLLNLDLKQGDQQALTGFIIVPLEPGNPDGAMPFDKRIAVNFNARDLDLSQLFASLGQKPPVDGKLTWKLLASGTVLNPNVNLTMNATGLKSQAEAAAQFDAAQLDLALHLAQKRVELEATLTQPLIKPLKITADAPLDVEAIMTNKQIDPQTPLDARVELPPTSLAVLPKVVPAIRRIDGTVGIDIRAGGTIEKPEFSGKASIRLKEARMTSPSVPPIGNFTADLAFTRDSLKFSTFKGTVGGGTFNLGGSIGLADLKKPVFDLNLKANEVLAMRNDSITVRADADLKLAGPLDSASASGTVWVVQSRFFKEIDILPIGLPGRPKPVPKSAPSESTNVSFPDPPLRDWKFDIAIKTRPDDPFLVRGNLANGAAHIDLKLGGTGLEPWLDGLIRIEEFKASLPFSKLEITQGFVYFNKEAPFQASLDIQAESRFRDTTVRAYISGTASDPQVEFTSEPPLPHADIVTLLATGTTRDELGGSGEAIASKAAILAAKSLYRKIFKKGAPPPEDEDDNDFLDRFNVELGETDARTGAQEITSRFEITDQTAIIGELDTQGRFTGSLKYLIRFR